MHPLPTTTHLSTSHPSHVNFSINNFFFLLLVWHTACWMNPECPSVAHTKARCSPSKLMVSITVQCGTVSEKHGLCADHGEFLCENVKNCQCGGCIADFNSPHCKDSFERDPKRGSKQVSSDLKVSQASLKKQENKCPVLISHRSKPMWKHGGQDNLHKC